MKKKCTAPPVTTGYDPRAVERSPAFTDGRLSENAAPLDEKDARSSPPIAPDGISGDWN